MMPNLREHKPHMEIWRLAAVDLGLNVLGPITLQLGETATVEADVLVRNFGGKEGMIIVSESQKIARLQHLLAEFGFGYTIYNCPGIAEEYDRDRLMGLLFDWVWTGPQDGVPNWYSEMESNYNKGECNIDT